MFHSNNTIIILISLLL